MVERVECVVIGAGVVGLAVARALALSGREVWVLEGAGGIGTGASSRNSEVVHAGIYYPAGSLKARFCVAGKAMLYEYCADRGIPHSRLGKLIVASDEAETPVLDTIRAKAVANGVTDLEMLDPDAVRALEPALRVAGALLSPSTGIVDSHALMLAFQGDVENSGGAVVCHAPVRGGVAGGSGFLLHVGGDEPMDLHCEVLVNAVGLHAPDVARGAEARLGDPGGVGVVDHVHAPAVAAGGLGEQRRGVGAHPRRVHVGRLHVQGQQAARRDGVAAHRQLGLGAAVERGHDRLTAGRRAR